MIELLDYIILVIKSTFWNQFQQITTWTRLTDKLILVHWHCTIPMLFPLVRIMKKRLVTLLMLWLRMLSSFSPKQFKPKRIKLHLLTHFLKNNKFMISPKLNSSYHFLNLESNSQEASNFLNKNLWPNGKDSPNKRTSKKERKLEWNTIHKPKLWLPDGEVNPKKMPLNLPSWRKNNSIETHSAIKRRRENSTKKSKISKNSKTWKEDKIT